ncbi:class I SAM-dependent methyltransferase [Paenibacillus glycanilyticus]|uniref:methyltransferase domain-containing protein n=1 Tax=Paenibacillus glycanilyticus TaxID=126569 RepID=UPI0020412123|nr:methyltransferase domain-containing protein [Paenibacillus glycanilyticus]MCM3627168.1 class I SAM-dependent methyltransferase [Paenibacillus glycanilyticus]
MSKDVYQQVGVAMTCRGFDEYLRMFDLPERELAQGKVLDVAGGGSSFTADAVDRGYDAIAADPRYVRDTSQWVEEAAAEIEASTMKLSKLRDYFDWTYYGSLERHREGRIESLKRFSGHLQSAEGRSRYLAGSLPELPFRDHSFSLVLCSHFLFLYAEQFGFEFHKQSILELMRVCMPGGEVRVYPLHSLGWKPFERMDELLAIITAHGGEPELLPSRLPFIPGSSSYMRIAIC